MTSRAGWATLLASVVLLGACSSTSDGAEDPGGPGTLGPRVADPTTPPTGPAVSPTDVLLTQDLPSGPPPRVPYLVGKRLSPGPWRLVRPNGDSRLVHVVPGQFAPVGDRLISLMTGEGGADVDVIGPDGRLAERPLLSSSLGLVTGAAGKAVGWVTLDRARLARNVVVATVDLRFADGTRWRLRVPPDAVLVGIRGGDACARRHDRCRVVVSQGRGTYLLGRHSRTRLTSHPANDVRADLATISTRAGTRCSGMWTRTGRRVWRDCRHGAVSFSPSGKHVLAIDGEGTQVATRRIFVLDDRGRVETSFRAPRRLAITGATWEDGRHLLVVVSRDWTTAYVVRVSVSGDAELVFASRGRIRTLVTYQLPAG